MFVLLHVRRRQHHRSRRLLGVDVLDRGIAEATISISSYRVESPGVEGVGLRTNQFRADNLDSGSFSRVAEEFLLASRISRWDREFAISVMDYFGDPMIETYGKLDQDTYVEGDVLDLPPSSVARMAVSEAIRQRRTRRYYTGDPLHLADIAALMRDTAGITGAGDVEKSNGDHVRYWYRAVPSGGGLYPVELQFVALNVRGLDRGVYRYAPRRDQLVRTGDAETADALVASVSTPEDDLNPEAAAGIFCLIGHPWRSMRKYGPRGLRFVLHESGAMAEHMHLVATSLGVGTADYSSFFDDDANDALDCDGLSRLVLHMVLVGVPSE
ncbi:SagB family peptide dehydrogenase [Nonomuraea roseoviolacea subsp. roseoviolacea]|uniref:SagB family peptide dehydrogenase n=1 Tax=Nonomuraea roseoviolacea TaxID=103837 RepID=UPI0031E2A290